MNLLQLSSPILGLSFTVSSSWSSPSYISELWHYFCETFSIENWISFLNKQKKWFWGKKSNECVCVCSMGCCCCQWRRSQPFQSPYIVSTSWVMNVCFSGGRTRVNICVAFWILCYLSHWLPQIGFWRCSLNFCCKGIQLFLLDIVFIPKDFLSSTICNKFNNTFIWRVCGQKLYFVTTIWNICC